MTGRHFPGTILWAWNIRLPSSTIIEASPGSLRMCPCKEWWGVHVIRSCLSGSSGRHKLCPFQTEKKWPYHVETCPTYLYWFCMVIWRFGTGLLCRCPASGWDTTLWPLLLNFDLGWMRLTKRHWLSRGFTTWEKPEEFGLFSQMPAERLYLGCRVRSDETFCPIPPQDRSGLFKATIRLMRLMLSDVPLPNITDDEQQLRNALLPLVHNKDGHFIATLSALLLSLLEGK